MTSGWQRTVMVALAMFFAVFFMKNLFLKDYDGETNSYLKQIGREDMIPKTGSDVRKERIQKQIQFEDLLTNMTAMQHEVAALRAEVNQLRGVGDESHVKKGKIIE